MLMEPFENVTDANSRSILTVDIREKMDKDRAVHAFLDIGSGYSTRVTHSESLIGSHSVGKMF